MAYPTEKMIDAGYDLANQIGPEGFCERDWLERVYRLMRSLEPPGLPEQSPPSQPRDVLQFKLPPRAHFEPSISLDVFLGAIFRSTFPPNLREQPRLRSWLAHARKKIAGS